MSERAEDEGVALPQPKWPIEDGLTSIYANYFSITSTPQEVVLVFGNFIPTGFSRRSEEEIKSYIENATVRPVSKIIMSHAGARALFAIMEDNLKQIAIREDGGKKNA
jgi:hypothetical protein